MVRFHSVPLFINKITAVEMAPAKAVEKMIECGMTPHNDCSI